MKRLFIAFFIAIAACFCLVSCKDDTFSSAHKNGDPIVDTTDEQDDESEREDITEMYITVNGNKLKVTLENNASVTALVAKLKQGDIIYTANDYGGFEVVGSLGFSLPRNDTQLTTQPGDVILYSGNQIVLFYGSNSWAYTRLGGIEGYSVAELRSLLGAGGGSRQVKISLE